MDIPAEASTDACEHKNKDTRSYHIGSTSNVLPEVHPPPPTMNSDTGVSTRNAPYQKASTEDSPPEQINTNTQRHWFALRTTYGREKKAYDYIIEHNGTAFLPTITTEKLINGKKKLVEVSRLPNIFFAYGTEEAIKEFVYDNVNLPFLRFYYKHMHVGAHIEKTPMIVPDNQIRSLQIICGPPTTSDILILPDEERKFKTGQKVRVKEGNFKGVEGVVARFQGQQRVGIVIDGLLTAATAYVPTAFLEKIKG